MKRLSLVLVMLAVVLVFGLAFAGCKSDTEVPKTMEGLFNELKGFNVGLLWASAEGINETIDWCATHKTWEPWDDNTGLVHGGTPAFSFADATLLQGNWSTTNNYDANAAVVRDIIKKLDAFFEDTYKLTATPETMNYTPGYERTWYTFYLFKNGRGGYGSSSTPSSGPYLRYYYQF